ncbi:MAG: hypothetical protein J0H12_03375 [Candidatus Paracaedimonas acanthamoebae]|mgnify:CR=1 FL=1|uniref:Uncharacterized protein n=1 Tax=Candidatus Paracaedimonas acanthamoebae TaxID=244581 RepID=A0A8J7PJL2_9PROT|nr:hypothetical protein [Candidatus Paracaedimonas acanthamoebae]
MKLLKKLSLVSSLAIIICTTSPLFASPSMSDYSRLENEYPSYFKGFSKTANDLNLIKSYRGKEEFRDPDERLSPKFTELYQALVASADQKLHSLAKDLKPYTEDKDKQNMRDYMYFLFTASLAISEHTDSEAQFFRAAGFSGTYSVIKSFDLKNPLKTIWRTLKKSYEKNDDRGDYTRKNGPLTFTDRTDNFSKKFSQSPFKDITYLMLCTEPNEDVLGLYYLAWTYYKGIHPVPVTLLAGDEKLHGIKMSSWGKVCHDSAHDILDLGDMSAEGFSVILTNYYLEKLTEKLKDLDSTEKKKYSIPKILPYINAFAISVYEAYQESLVAILESSIVPLLKTEKSTPSSDLTAFMAGAFIHAHEEPILLSPHLATSNLQDILQNSMKQFTSRIDDSTEISALKDEGEPKTPSIQGSFSTSYITGETTLTDEEIFEIVKKKKLSEYFHTPYQYFLNSKYSTIEEDKIAEYSIIRNPFYIQINIVMIDGSECLYRELSNYSKQLNLDHDRHLLLPAEVVLAEKYNYSIPVVPSKDQYPNDSTSFEKAVEECLLQLEKGRGYLMKFFLAEAVKFSTSSTPEGATIADQFAAKYSEALSKLQTEIPAFIGDLQQFLSAATATHEIENISLIASSSKEEN